MKSIVRDPEDRESVRAVLHREIALARGRQAAARSHAERNLAAIQIDTLLLIYRPLLGDTDVSDRSTAASQRRRY